MSLTNLLLFIAGLALLLTGAEFLVRGAARLAAVFGISTLVIGLTVVSLGTSAPELAISSLSAYRGNPDIAVGNVVGSNIANVLLILGIAALVTPLIVRKQLIRWDVPIMIGATLLLVLFAWDLLIAWWEGLIFTLLAVSYLAFAGWMGKRSPDPDEEVDELIQVPKNIPRDIALVIGGLVGLAVGSQWLVQSAVEVAGALGVPELVIAETVVAIGTSLPEVATSIIAALRGQRDLAVGNVVGSNIMNILLVLGVSGLVAGSVGIAVQPLALTYSIPLALAVSVACVPIFFTGHRIDRWEGGFFLFFYAAFLAYAVLNVTNSEWLPTYEQAMAFIVIPLAVLTIIATLSNYLLKRKRASEG